LVKPPYKKLKDGLKMVADGSVVFDDMKATVGTTTSREVLNIVRKMRFPTKIKRNGKTLFVMEGNLTKDEYEVVKDIVEFDIKLGKYITEKSPDAVLTKLFKAGKLTGDRFAGLKYAIAVSSGDMDVARQTLDYWKLYMQSYRPELVNVVKKAKFIGSFEDFTVQVRNKVGLNLVEMVDMISDMPPIYRAIYEDKSGKRYVVLNGGYGGQNKNVFQNYTIMWDEDILKQDAGVVVNSFLLGSIDHVLFTGTGRLIEEYKQDSLVYYLLDYLKFSLMEDKVSHKYIVMAGLDIGDVAIPVVRGEFNTIEEAKRFIEKEVIQKYMEAQAEKEELVKKAWEMIKEQEIAMEKQERELEIGGMYA